MDKKPYSLYKRRLDSGRTVYYARFRLDNGSWSTAKSTGQSTKTSAEAWAIKYLASGQVVLKENITFKEFAQGFFDYDGTYVQSQLFRGRSFGRRHAENQNAIINNYLIDEFGDLKLTRIHSDHIEEFAQGLSALGKSSSTINKILLALRTILQYAQKKKYIQQVPLIDMLPNKQKDRGILTIEEVKSFFSQEWNDPRYYAINLIAATTGMRMGEIRALKRKVVHNDYLEISVSWEKGYGLKGTKTGRSRNVPIPEKTYSAIQEVMALSPYREPDDLVFFGRKRAAPLDHRAIERSFHAALKNIGITDEIRKERRICFHSWRHFFNSMLINSRIPIIKVQTLTGHSTNRMTEQYFHTNEYQDVLDITGRIV
ncbi:MAG: site-specific integrase [Spirochaetales bacterium]|nr:site-specific integrase [Spirochaetales bacterium]